MNNQIKKFCSPLRNIVKLFLIAVALGFTGISNAQLIDYRIIVQTKSDCDFGWLDGCGTDNHIYMIMTGTNGKSSKIKLQGSHEAGQTDPTDYRGQDIGIITEIWLDVSGDLADKWGVEHIQILRGTKKSDENTADGHSTFNIRKDLSYDPISFNTTSQKKPSVTITPNGEPEYNDERLTMVSFGSNPHPTADQFGMRYTEKWGSVERLSVATTKSSTAGGSITLSYSSPETVAGQFGAEAKASYDETITKERKEESENFSESVFNWEYLIPANRACFRLVEFKIPHEYQKYDVDGKTIVVRKLHAVIAPTGIDRYIYIPEIDPQTNKVIPILWKEIEDDWLSYMEPEMRRSITDNERNNWLAKGWVVMKVSDIK